MNRNDLKALARMRLQEAKSLLSRGHYSGAYYLAGYVVECALKACIARQTKRHEFPEKSRVNASWTHKLTHLAEIAGLTASREAESKVNLRFSANWDVVKDWNEDSRYHNWSQKQAKDLIRAISERQYGVLTWLRRHW